MRLAGYETFEHTADLGVRVYAPTRAGLIAPATAALYTIVGRLRPGRAIAERTVAATGDDPALLLRDYLAEILHGLQVEHWLLADPLVEEFSDKRLVVQGRVVAIDPAGSVFEREVKAVTYHELAVRACADGYEATFIVDI
ncbi:MAG: archease [Planctomycetota bacterium]